MIPATQSEAWQDILRRLPVCEAAVLRFFIDNPRSTRNELDLALSSGSPNSQGSRRIAAMVRNGTLRVFGSRVCRVTGRTCSVYEATGNQPSVVAPRLPARKRLERLCLDIEATMYGNPFVESKILRAVLDRANNP